MGRPEREIPARGTARAELALFLRKGRARKGLTYAALAVRTAAYSAATLQRAASGRSVPERQVAREYAMACGLDVEAVDQLWLAARREARRRDGGVARAAPVPGPSLMRDMADLAAGLADLHELGGAPSRREMERRARASGEQLSSSAVQRILTRRQIPGSRGQLVAFLRVCDVPERQHSVWIQAWLRVRRRHAVDAAADQSALEQEERDAADGDSPHITAEQAVGIVRAAGYRPCEQYRSFTAPWTVRCALCAAVKRIRVSDLAAGLSIPCSQCDSTAERTVREVWRELLDGRGWAARDAPADEANLLSRCHVAAVSREGTSVHITIGVPSQLLATVGFAAVDSATWEALISSDVCRRLPTVTDVRFGTYTDRLN